MAKRNRVFRSSSAGEIELPSHIHPIDSLSAYWEAKRPALAKSARKPAAPMTPKPPLVEAGAQVKNEEKTRGCVFTIGSSDTEAGSKKIRSGDSAAFLQICFLCKKKLKAKDDLFMYGCLGAFCSPECRDCQISLDGFEREVSREPPKLTTPGDLKKQDLPRQKFGIQHQSQAQRYFQDKLYT